MMALGVRVQSPRICRRGVGVRLQEVEGMPAGLSPECLPVRRVPLTPPNRLSFGPRSPAAEPAFLCSVCVARGQVLVPGKTLGSFLWSLWLELPGSRGPFSWVGSPGVQVSDNLGG